MRQNALTQKTLLNDVELPLKCEEIRHISSPVLLVSGERSKPINGMMNQVLTNCLQQSTKVTISDAGQRLNYASRLSLTNTYGINLI